MVAFIVKLNIIAYRLLLIIVQTIFGHVTISMRVPFIHYFMKLDTLYEFNWHITNHRAMNVRFLYMWTKPVNTIIAIIISTHLSTDWE